MEQVLSPKDFVPRESVEKAEILVVFPFFHTAQLGQKIRRKPQSPLCGVAIRNGCSQLRLQPFCSIIKLPHVMKTTEMNYTPIQLKLPVDLERIIEIWEISPFLFPFGTLKINFQKGAATHGRIKSQENMGHCEPI